MPTQMPEGERHGVRCRCGAKLVDVIDPPEVQVGAQRFRFRRTTDYLACVECRLMYRITDVGPELLPDDEQP